MAIDVVRIRTELSDSCSAQNLLTWGINEQPAAILFESPHQTAIQQVELSRAEPARL